MPHPTPAIKGVKKTLNNLTAECKQKKGRQKAVKRTWGKVKIEIAALSEQGEIPKQCQNLGCQQVTALHEQNKVAKHWEKLTDIC